MVPALLAGGALAAGLLRSNFELPLASVCRRVEEVMRNKLQ